MTGNIKDVYTVQYKDGSYYKYSSDGLSGGFTFDLADAILVSSVEEAERVIGVGVDEKVVQVGIDVGVY